MDSKLFLPEMERNGMVRMDTISVGNNLSHFCVVVSNGLTTSGSFNILVVLEYVHHEVSLHDGADSSAHIAAYTQCV